MIFDQMPASSIINWKFVLTSDTHNGLENDTKVLFDQMQMSHITLHKVPTLILVSSCSYQGFRQHAANFHDVTVEQNIEHTLWNVILDLYAKCEDFDTVLRMLPEILVTQLVISRGNTLLSISCSNINIFFAPVLRLSWDTLQAASKHGLLLEHFIWIIFSCLAQIIHAIELETQESESNKWDAHAIGVVRSCNEVLTYMKAVVCGNTMQHLEAMSLLIRVTVITLFAALYGHQPPNIARYIMIHLHFLRPHCLHHFHKPGTQHLGPPQLFPVTSVVACTTWFLIPFTYLHLEDKVNFKGEGNVMNPMNYVGIPNQAAQSKRPIKLKKPLKLIKEVRVKEEGIEIIKKYDDSVQWSGLYISPIGRLSLVIIIATPLLE